MASSLPQSASASVVAPLQVLYRDDHLIAVHKPPGLLVHRTWLAEDPVFLLQALRDQIGQRVYPIHRLDRATSGVILFALDTAAAHRCAVAFESRAVTKRYLAVVRGWLPQAGVIEHALADPETGVQSQPAVTAFWELARIELPIAVDRYPTSRYALASICPKTGRRHQIRKHFKHIHHHLIGDTTYGKGTHNRLFREQFGVSRLLLHANHLALDHPFAEQCIEIDCPIDATWARLMRQFGWPSDPGSAAFGVLDR